MSSRHDILRTIRAQAVPPASLPDLRGSWIRYVDRVQTFQTSVESAGGHVVLVRDVVEINSRLAEIATWQAASKTVSLVAGVGHSTFDLAAVADPHALEDVDFAIVPGEFGVAENGAVWVTDAHWRHRALPFIVQHLAFVLLATDVIDNMHQAYERLTFVGPGFGTFISGPSKTADIEQSLVIGAHGPRSLTVFFIGEPEARASG